MMRCPCLCFSHLFHTCWYYAFTCVFIVCVILCKCVGLFLCDSRVFFVCACYMCVLNVVVCVYVCFMYAFLCVCLSVCLF